MRIYNFNVIENDQQGIHILRRRIVGSNELYNEILKKRGKEAHWYSRNDRELEEWEKLPSLNGITVGKFRRIVAKNNGWNVLYWSNKPILSDGKRANMLVFRIHLLIVQQKQL